ncbi:MAG: YceD family protein [Moorellales bacterium]
MHVDVGDLRRQPGRTIHFSFRQTLPSVEMAGEHLEFVGPVAVEGNIASGDRVLIAEGKVRVVVRRQCSRCLSHYTEEVVAPLEAEFVHGSQLSLLPEKTREQALVFDGNEIDLRPTVEEAILLALPMKALCRPDCPGLCPRCGKDLREGPCACPPAEEDERLAVLRNLITPLKGSDNEG